MGKSTKITMMGFDRAWFRISFAAIFVDLTNVETKLWTHYLNLRESA